MGFTKVQIKAETNWRTVDSSKNERTSFFFCFAFLLFMAKKQTILSVHFLGESTKHKSTDGFSWPLQGSTTCDNFDGPDVTLLVCFVTRHLSPFFLLKWVRWATAAIYVFLTSLPPYILQDRLAAIWVKNSLMVW